MGYKYEAIPLWKIGLKQILYPLVIHYACDYGIKNTDIYLKEKTLRSLPLYKKCGESEASNNFAAEFQVEWNSVHTH